MKMDQNVQGGENLETIKADLDRLKGEISNLLSDTIKVPRNAVFGDLEAATRQQPLKYLGIALAVGFVVGRIMR